MKNRWQILVVDDESVVCESLAAWLREDGYQVDTAASGHQAVERTRQREYAISFVALRMPGGMDGIETMMQIRRLRPEASIVVMTAYETVAAAIAAIQDGAQEYILKPCNPVEVSLLVDRIVKVKNLQRENRILRTKLDRQYKVRDMAAKNARMRDILALCQEVASLAGQAGTPAVGGSLQAMEMVLIQATLERTKGNIKESASILGIDRSTLYEKIRRYGIPR